MSVKLDHGQDGDLDEQHEINVTPFIDVMLVLLIIFMVAAPLATVNVPVELPASAAQPQPQDEDPVLLSVKADLTLAIGDDIVTREALTGTLDRATKGDKERRIFLRADKSVGYGDLMDVMNVLRGGGYLKIALVSLEAPAPAASGP